MSFLTAEWRKLAVANYKVEPSCLKEYLPYKTEMDFWQGTCYVSLVGFMFVNTKLLGFPIPFHRNFEEVNLRFYVRYKSNNEWKRGVVFIKEIVPKAALTMVANSFYREHYQTMRMSHHIQEFKDYRTVKYCWGHKNLFLIKASLDAKMIQQGTETEFITEHYWGYTKVNNTKTYQYEVTHPKWMAYKVLEHEIDVDFRKIYGHPFADLQNQAPKSVMLAEGSKITVESKSKI